MNSRMSPSSRRSSIAQDGEARWRRAAGRCRGLARCTRPGRWRCVSAWAGPSWISWARRERSASCGLDDPHRHVARSSRARPPGTSSVSSPRSRKSHVRSSVRCGELELGQLGLVVAELDDQPVDIALQRPRAGLVDRRQAHPHRRGSRRHRGRARLAAPACGSRSSRSRSSRRVCQRASFSAYASR